MTATTSLERQTELLKLAASVISAADAERVLKEQALYASPGENTSVFYYGQGVRGAEALATRTCTFSPAPEMQT